MKSKPLVSVIIPTYNNSHFIGFALESLFQQTYPEERIEIIVVDDGSTDNTCEFVKKYLDKIIYVYQENRGIAGARNKGISLARGEIITFLDSDDIWLKQRVEKVIDKFNEKKEAGIVYHPVGVIDSNGLSIYENFYKAFGYKEALKGKITKDIISGRIFCGGSSFAFRKEIMDRIYPIPEDIRRGIDFYVTAVSSCYTQVVYIPEILGKYRIHDDNTTMLTGQYNYKKLAAVNKDFAYMRQKVIEKIQKMDPSINKTIDLNIMKRIQTKEMIFYSTLNGKRLEGIQQIPSLFKGNLTLKDILNGIAVSLMALFIPAPLYPKLVKGYGLLKKSKIINL